MRYTAYSSKLFTGLTLVVLLAFGAVIFLFAPGLPLFAAVIFGALIGLGVLAQLAQLVSSKPRLQIDEDGIRCYQAFYDPIPWSDIVSAERAPRVEKLPRGYQMSFCDAWRSIDLAVRRLDKYSKLLPAGVHNLLSDGFRQKDDPEVFRLRLDMTGLSGSSAEALEVIQFYLAKGGAERVSERAHEASGNA